MKMLKKLSEKLRAKIAHLDALGGGGYSPIRA